MQNNYYFLRQLTRQIASRITGLKLMECFSQEKDELVLGFAAARGKKKNYKEFFIKAAVFPDFSSLYFTEQFERARKNSADLFNQLIDLEILGLRQFLNERCFAIEFEQGFSMVFKMYGNRSNIILFQGDEVIDLFHSRIVADKNLKVSTLDRAIDQSYDAFLAHKGDYKKLFPTFGKVVNAYLDQEPVSWEKIQEVVHQLENPVYYLIRWEHQLHLSLLPLGEVVQEYQEPIEALNTFYVQYNRVSSLDKEKAEILRKLNKEKKQTELYLKDAYQRLEMVDSTIKNEEIGHILMANLHQIPERAEKAELFDFYRNQNLIIKLRPDLSPQRNAENFYRKAKNEKIEIEKIVENIESREELLRSLNLHIEKIEEAEQLKALRSYLKVNKLVRNSTQALQYKDLFKRFEIEGFEILVGRNAKNNDLLTQQYAYKEDLWLHARDAQGSHVVVKYKAGKKIPNTVKEAAASLAAYYSKRRNESLSPVILTLKKYVRKTKDLAEGQVIIEKEEVVMVEPKLPHN